MVQCPGGTLIMDNGAYSVKVGWSIDKQPRVVPNCVVKTKNDRKRIYVGEELEDCVEKGSLYYNRPAERGYIVNWDTQQKVWEGTLRNTPTKGANLVFTHPGQLVPAIRDNSCEILFESFQFNGIYPTSTANLIGMAPRRSRACLVVDCGFSFTHIVPLLDGLVIEEGLIRVDVGGKMLTNQLKEWVSFRDVNVVEETHMMNECKEDACFVSLDFSRDMTIAGRRGNDNSIVREYVLPDYVSTFRGVLRAPIKNPGEDAQKIRLNVERFSVPEALFSPSDIGIEEMGIAEAIAESVARCPPNLSGLLLSNIHLIGGSTLFPNFTERLLREVRSLTEGGLRVGIAEDQDGVDPITRGWAAGRSLVEGGGMDIRNFVTIQDYREHGADRIGIRKMRQTTEDAEEADDTTTPARRGRQ